MKNNYLYNKKILSYCPNFHRIVNADFYEEDKMTKKLLKIYEDYIFSVDLQQANEKEKLIKLDQILYKYLEDYHFRGELKKGLKEIKIENKVNNVMDFIISKIIEIFTHYTEGYTRNIYISRWI